MPCLIATSDRLHFTDAETEAERQRLVTCPRPLAHREVVQMRLESGLSGAQLSVLSSTGDDILKRPRVTQV